MTDKVGFLRLPISLPCPVPIRPGDPSNLDADGEPLPLEDRTERCAVDAFWMVGNQVTCDVHLRQFCAIAGLDYDDIEREAGGPFSIEQLPWHQRHRYSQEQAEPPETEAA